MTECELCGKDKQRKELKEVWEEPDIYGHYYVCTECFPEHFKKYPKLRWCLLDDD